jgi:NAD(P)-dependent dehydrogenase (short-subunit alcohol dehydrogenase family)
MNRLSNKSVIITGAAGGMGKEEALLFAKEGANVIATDVNYDALHEWVQEARSQGWIIEDMKHDVTSQMDWSNVVDQCISSFGKIDVLLNNAGVISTYRTIEDTTEDEWKRIIDINMMGPFLGCKAVLPFMKINGSGSVINVASIAGVVGGYGPAYCASKAGVRLLTKDMALELSKYNIRVNALVPGVVLTPMTEVALEDPDVHAMLKSMSAQGRIAAPIEIANGALFLASDESSFMTGADLVIDGGYLAK